MLPLFLAVLPQVPADRPNAVDAAAACVPVAISAPAAAAQDPRGRRIGIRVRVAPDGSVAEVEFPADTRNEAREHVSLAVTQQWRFQPHACGPAGEGAWVASDAPALR